MGNQNDGLSVASHFTDDFQQEFDFLGSQHRRRFVEDQDLRFAIEHLQDFNTLLHGNVQIFDLRCGIHFQSELLGQLCDFLVCIFNINTG